MQQEMNQPISQTEMEMHKVQVLLDGARQARDTPRQVDAANQSYAANGDDNEYDSDDDDPEVEDLDSPTAGDEDRAIDEEEMRMLQALLAEREALERELAEKTQQQAEAEQMERQVSQLLESKMQEEREIASRLQNVEAQSHARGAGGVELQQSTEELGENEAKLKAMQMLSELMREKESLEAELSDRMKEQDAFLQQARELEQAEANEQEQVQQLAQLRALQASQSVLAQQHLSQQTEVQQSRGTELNENLLEQRDTLQAQQNQMMLALSSLAAEKEKLTKLLAEEQALQADLRHKEQDAYGAGLGQ